MLIKHSNVSNIIRFTLKNSSTGIGLTGLTNASAELIIATICNNEATTTVYTQAASNIETIAALGTYAAPSASKCRFKEVDATNHKGLYEFQFANARFAIASARSLVISVTGAASLLDVDYEIQLVSFDPHDSVRMGMTALPNAAADGAGGLPISDAGGLDLDTKLANAHEITAARMGALTDWIDGGRLDLLLDAIPTVGEIQAEMEENGASLLDTIRDDLANGTDGLGALKALIDALNNVSTSDLATALTNIHLDHLLAVDYDPASKPGIATALLNELVENDGGVSRLTQNALEQAPGATPPTVGEIRTEMEGAGTKLSNVLTDTETTLDALIKDIPTNSEFNARTLLSADYITVADIIAGIADGSYDLQKMIRIIFAALSGKSSGGGTSTLNFRDSGDAKNRISATVDSDGNRTNVSLDGS